MHGPASSGPLPSARSETEAGLELGYVASLKRGLHSHPARPRHAVAAVPGDRSPAGSTGLPSGRVEGQGEEFRQNQAR